MAYRVKRGGEAEGRTEKNPAVQQLISVANRFVLIGSVLNADLAAQ
ncbi:Uncharacterised protein [Yersinia mollaretii]|nr:Uncharacterised protein [Yersinia mollaretii]CQJ10319.1 Uncharacterised protein [Yersinia mollaretii]